MPSSTGSELAAVLQEKVDRLWVACVNCPLADRQAMWDRGVAAIALQAGPEFQCAAMEDALQDAGFRLGLFNFDARSIRRYGIRLGR